MQWTKWLQRSRKGKLSAPVKRSTWGYQKQCSWYVALYNAMYLVIWWDTLVTYVCTYKFRLSLQCQLPVPTFTYCYQLKCYFQLTQVVRSNQTLPSFKHGLMTVWPYITVQSQWTCLHCPLIISCLCVPVCTYVPCSQDRSTPVDPTFLLSVQVCTTYINYLLVCHVCCSIASIVRTYLCIRGQLEYSVPADLHHGYIN